MLRSRELVPFGAAVTAGAVAVMTSHVLVPALDPRPAGDAVADACSAVLRDELGFDGVVVTDALDMRGASAGRGEPAAAVLSLAAGCDLLCLGADKDADLHARVVAAVVDAVRSGALPEDRLADAADRVLAAGRTIRELQDAAGPDVDDGASAEVAGRAVRVEGQLPPLAGATVLRLRTGTNIAVGDVPWGLPVRRPGARRPAGRRRAGVDAVRRGAGRGRRRTGRGAGPSAAPAPVGAGAAARAGRPLPAAGDGRDGLAGRRSCCPGRPW